MRNTPTLTTAPTMLKLILVMDKSQSTTVKFNGVGFNAEIVVRRPADEFVRRNMHAYFLKHKTEEREILLMELHRICSETLGIVWEPEKEVQETIQEDSQEQSETKTEDKKPAKQADKKKSK